MTSTPEWDRYILTRDRLWDLGLDERLWKQLEQCGPTIALPLMVELERSGRDAIHRVNATLRDVSRELARARGSSPGMPSSLDAGPT